MRIALGVEYDGEKFCGWQKQPGLRSVQSTLEEAIAHIAGETVTATCAGRTDAEVHALEQVVHFDTQVRRPDHAWVRGVNSHLPSDIAVLWAKVVPDDFHARYSAQSRTYHYWLLAHPIRPVIGVTHMGWVHTPLDVPAMVKAMDTLLGEHDFSAFRSSECQAKTPVKIMHQAYLEEHQDMLQFVFQANAFLHHMVRNLVGSLVYIGQGRESSSWITDLLAMKNRQHAAPTFAPQGLYLAQVDYDRKWQLPNNDGRTHTLTPRRRPYAR